MRDVHHLPVELQPDEGVAEDYELDVSVVLFFSRRVSASHARSVR